MVECEYKKECKLIRIISKKERGLCEKLRINSDKRIKNIVYAPIIEGPELDDFLDAEYCPAWRLYESEKKGKLLPRGPYIDLNRK